MSLNNHPIICLTGPTAVGKTDIAISLAQTLPCEIISVDSAMVYKGMNIGTAKPSADLLEKSPHHLIDICDPAEVYSVGRFLKDAQSIIEASILQKRIPLLVGGTMLYFYALYKGIAQLPTSQENTNLRQQLSILDTTSLYQKLKQYDVKAAARIHSNDRQRIERALFVYESTGQTLSELQTISKIEITHPMIWIIIYPSNRDELRSKIATRFHNMLDRGLIKEVSQLHQRGDLSLKLPACRAVGYRQIWEYLEGKINYTIMKENSITATCQLAKRQLTWLNKWPHIQYFLSDTPDLINSIEKYIKKQLDN